MHETGKGSEKHCINRHEKYFRDPRNLWALVMDSPILTKLTYFAKKYPFSWGKMRLDECNTILWYRSRSKLYLTGFSVIPGYLAKSIEIREPALFRPGQDLGGG